MHIYLLLSDFAWVYNDNEYDEEVVKILIDILVGTNNQKLPIFIQESGKKGEERRQGGVSKVQFVLVQDSATQAHPPSSKQQPLCEMSRQGSNTLAGYHTLTGRARAVRPVFNPPNYKP